MTCSSTLSTKSYVHTCTLVEGHDGPHRSIEGFWWIDQASTDTDLRLRAGVHRLAWRDGGRDDITSYELQELLDEDS